MKSYRKELWFEVRQRRELINITREVEVALAESGIAQRMLTFLRPEMNASLLCWTT